MATPYVTIVRDVATSTQDLAATEFDRTGGPVLVVAAEQTQGRGRTGNEWWQATRGVAASLSLAADAPPVDETLPLAVGLAVRSAIEAAAAVAVDLKWPNDIELHALKVGGILVERSGGRVVVGVGLNLFWPDAPADAAGILTRDPGLDLGRTISEAWASSVLAPGFAWDREAYVAACTTVGRRVTWDPDGSGTVQTIDANGGLVVDTGEGVVTLRSGEVRAIRA
ncbi:MAG: biotin--[acetyl-CoA-carboxylase] ligase [Acidimicrobiia bacterium]|nr:biotin--[acetyl-CoA-carboxylase] ligase [Acidimicrobiia bacterium]